MIPKPAGCIRIVSLNVNGLRAAVRKGLLPWLTDFEVDIAALQETRLYAAQWLDSHQLPGWQAHLFPAQRAGYSGTAIYSRLPFTVGQGLGFELAEVEGRCIEAAFTHQGQAFSVASIYFPSGASNPASQLRKDHFLQQSASILDQWANSRSMLICADVNIAHRDIDLKNWRANQGCSGLLPHERRWFDERLQAGYVDLWRDRYPDACQYSWWSQRGRAFEQDVGWRIDYQLGTPDWQKRLVQAGICRLPRLSDHAAVWADYQF